MVKTWLDEKDLERIEEIKAKRKQKGKEAEAFDDLCDLLIEWFMAGYREIT